ncbi:MAG: hypothetical protein PHH14_00575 [Candidatus Margulisbacteria bacterium]|nr:hypothetical protein [Candidatus Margulisiibacteriota bacterium]
MNRRAKSSKSTNRLEGKISQKMKLLIINKPFMADIKQLRVKNHIPEKGCGNDVSAYRFMIRNFKAKRKIDDDIIFHDTRIDNIDPVLYKYSLHQGWIPFVNHLIIFGKRHIEKYLNSSDKEGFYMNWIIKHLCRYPSFSSFAVNEIMTGLSELLRKTGMMTEMRVEISVHVKKYGIQYEEVGFRPVIYLHKRNITNDRIKAFSEIVGDEPTKKDIYCSGYDVHRRDGFKAMFPGLPETKRWKRKDELLRDLKIEALRKDTNVRFDPIKHKYISNKDTDREIAKKMKMTPEAVRTARSRIKKLRNS